VQPEQSDKHHAVNTTNTAKGGFLLSSKDEKLPDQETSRHSPRREEAGS